MPTNGEHRGVAANSAPAVNLVVGTSTRSVRRALDDLGAPAGTQFVLADPLAEHLASIAERKGFVRREVPPLATGEREDLLREYVESMARLAAANRQRSAVWWLTDIASKNRFRSPLPTHLTILVRTIAACSMVRPVDRELCVLGISWPVAAALRNLGPDCVLREPPVGGGKRLARRVGAMTREALGLARGAFASTRRILEARRRDSEPARTVPRREAWILQTFAYPSSFTSDGEFQDPFMGRLAEFLRARLPAGTALQLVALGLGDRRECSRQMARTGSPAPLERFMRPSDPWRCLVTLAVGRLRGFAIPSGLTFAGTDIAPLVRELLRQGGGHVPLFQALYEVAGRRIATRYDVVGCTMTYEGNPWERALTRGIRERCDRAVVIGYQHSVVPQAAAGVFTGNDEGGTLEEPDLVLTTGIEATKILQRYRQSGPGVQTAGALRYSYLRRVSRPPSHDGRPVARILVALEGVPEVVSLVKYAIEQATMNPGVEFRIRAHPVFPLDRLLSLIHLRASQLPSNVVESTGGPVVADVDESDLVLYWGTTVAVEAVHRGVPVVHYDRGDFLSYDPLFDLTALKWDASRGIDLVTILGQVDSLPPDERRNREALARQYVDRYFCAGDDEALAGFLPRSMDDPPGAESRLQKPK